MRVRRRRLRGLLVAVGCLVGMPEGPHSAMGLVVLAAGAALHLASKGVLEQNQRLTTAGPYRWTRNPFYLANALIDLGLCLVIGRLWVAVGYAVLWGLAYRETIEREEERLRGLFGSEFDRYAARVPRLLPFRSPLSRSEASGRFRWSNPSLAQGREYARLLGVVLAAGAIFAAARVRSLGLEILAPAHREELGWIVLLAAGWILKLGLAEAMRRPRTALLPAAAGSLARVGLEVGLWAPLLVAGSLRDGVAAAGIVSVALLAVLVLSGRMETGAGRLPREVAAASVALAIALRGGGLWLACLPILGHGLAFLDEIARRRCGGLPDAERALWPYLPRIAGGTVVLLVALAIGLD